MQAPEKSQFLRAYGFPDEWEAWGWYPDTLFEGQLRDTANDIDPQPDEHLRYGAFLWWVNGHRGLSWDALAQLLRLAVLDPDTFMAGAAMHDILHHPNADTELASFAAELLQNYAGWSHWRLGEDKLAVFKGWIDEGRAQFVLRERIHRLAVDLKALQMTELELRGLYANAHPPLLLGLVKHPNLPGDLLLALSQLQSVTHARSIRVLAAERLRGKAVAVSEYFDRYSRDPWFAQG